MNENPQSVALVQHEGRSWVRVPDVDRMPPFLVSVVSPSDHWLYASSTGGLAAGRVDAEGSLFPYVTDDKLHRARHEVGSWTRFSVREPDGSVTRWEPFRPRNDGGVRRHLLKSVAGDRLILEEELLALGLVFRIQWAFSEEHGFVRGATLSRRGGQGTLAIELVDGLQGLLPANAPLSLTQSASCLVDAYTRSEWDEEGQLALITLEAQPTDRAEPLASLRATVAWCAGLEPHAVLLSRRQLEDVGRGATPEHEGLVTGRPGAFLVASSLSLEPGAQRRWQLVADVMRSQLDVAALRRRPDAEMPARLEAELDATSARLDGILADADGLQLSGDRVYDAHHRANALFNTMRGGLPVDEQRVCMDRFAAWVAARNRPCHDRNAAWFGEREGCCLERAVLIAAAEASGDSDLIRLAREHLPLWFGRRHGDPSRPWNRFHIRVRDPDGGRRVSWEGNWRDVFQNWEALLASYPAFLDAAVATFVNASTRDGHNPYRIGSDGVDWEQPDPDDPWSNLGYWGDHQVSYLTRLLEASLRHHPERLPALLGRELFSYADVPYRLRPYDDLLADPRDSIVFDDQAQRAVEARVERLGADGRLVPDGEGVLHVTLAEKLLVPVLAKLSSLVPGGGIWLNTQRPEWNDANNALAGYGVSVVTAAYLLSHLRVLIRLFDGHDEPVQLTSPVARWFDTTLGILILQPPPPRDDLGRRMAMNALGRSAQGYRTEVYRGEPPSRTERPVENLRTLLRRAVLWLHHTLGQARRPDGLFDGYDLLEIRPDTVGLQRLGPMLEGQVAVLSSGLLDPSEAVALLEGLFDGPLYRADVDSFVLYPARRLPSFMDRNRVPDLLAEALPRVSRWLEDGEGPLARDAEGTLRFGADLRNAADLARRLEELEVPQDERHELLELWELTFQHQRFTGRSGSMYAYEGLGSVYWHMVGKLLLAAQETWWRAHRDGTDPAVLARLAALYRRIRGGLGTMRSAEAFGAIPTDPYSHTPAGRGAQQPGMTGLVKEELLARRGELGIVIEGGCIRFEPTLLQPEELLAEPTRWHLPAGVRPEREVEVPAGGLAFMLCGLPVVYEPADEPVVELQILGGDRRFAGNGLDLDCSQLVFQRDLRLLGIRVGLPGLQGTP